MEYFNTYKDKIPVLAVYEIQIEPGKIEDLKTPVS